jgi:hypothetical protein
MKTLFKNIKNTFYLLLFFGIPDHRQKYIFLREILKSIIV